MLLFFEAKIRKVATIPKLLVQNAKYVNIPALILQICTIPDEKRTNQLIVN